MDTGQQAERQDAAAAEREAAKRQVLARRIAELQDWCGAALTVVGRIGEDVGPWTVQVYGVVDPADLRGSPDRAARSLVRDVTAMQARVEEALPVWTAEGLTVLRGTLERASGGEGRPAPVLVAGAPALTDLPTALLGFRAAKPLLGLVAVVRGYVLSAPEDAGPGGTPERSTTWLPGGPAWPADASEGQPAVGAFAADRHGTTAMLAVPMAGAGRQLRAGTENRLVDLERASGGALAYPTPAASPPVVLGLACGHRNPLPPEIRSLLPRPGWVVGRWALHEAWQAAQAWTADPATPVALPVPPAALADGTWAAIRADQAGPRRLGPLLRAAEARLLAEPLLAEACIARSPAQAWLWRSLEQTLGGTAEGRALLDVLKAQWQRRPQLHEPDDFLGAAATPYR